MGSYLITETMDNYPEIGFESYDRFFPNQDTMPAGGFGNLIALPLQKIPRNQGNSVFLDSSFSPHEDQWAFLESAQKMAPQQVALLAKEGSSRGRIVGLKLPLEDMIIMVRGMYEDHYGDEWEERLLEQGRLCFMTRRLHPNGDPVRWEIGMDC